MNNPNIIEKVGYESMKEGLVIGKSFVVEKKRGKVMVIEMLVMKK